MAERLFSSAKNRATCYARNILVIIQSPSTFLAKSEDNTYSHSIGDGLFSSMNFIENDVVATFHGKVITYTEYLSKKAMVNCDYVIQLSKHKEYMDCEDARRNGTCLASLSNSPTHCWNTSTGSKAKANCKLVVRKIDNVWNAYLVATQDIARHTEIAWHYSSAHIMSASITIQQRIDDTPRHRC